MLTARQSKLYVSVLPCSASAVVHIYPVVEFLQISDKPID